MIRIEIEKKLTITGKEAEDIVGLCYIALSTIQTADDTMGYSKDSLRCMTKLAEQIIAPFLPPGYLTTDKRDEVQK